MKERKAHHLRILLEKIWTYAVEVIVAGLMSVVLWISLGGKTIEAWELEKRTDLLALTAVAAALSAAIFAAYFAVLSTDFGKKLRVRRVAAEYASAFAFPFVLLTLTMVTLEFLAKDSGTAVPRSATFLLCYSCVNCVTMVKNVVGIVQLWEESE